MAFLFLWISTRLDKLQDMKSVSEFFASLKIIPAFLITFLPGLAGLYFLPFRTMFYVFSGLIIFSLPGFPAIRLLNENISSETRAISALPVGYLISSLVAAILIPFIHPHVKWVFVAVIAVTILLYALSTIWHSDSRHQPAFSHPLFFLLSALFGLLITVLLSIPYSKVGLLTEHGYAYNAYFSGDFLKHVAVTAELLHGKIPPDNPFYKGVILHYYWMFYLFPSMIARLIDPGRIQAVLISVNLFIAGNFIFIWCHIVNKLLKKNLLKFLVAFIPVFGASLEGITVLGLIYSRHHPLILFHRYNIDGFSRWLLGSPEIDTVYRLLLYNMQHILPVTLFLFCLAFIDSPALTRKRTLAGLGILTALSIGQSGFLGTFLALYLTLCVVFIGKTRFVHRVRNVVIFALPVVLAVGIYKFQLHMVGGKFPFEFHIADPMRSNAFAYLFLNFGAACLGIPAIFFWKKFHRPTILLAAVPLLISIFIRTVEWGDDVAIKLGYLIALSLALLLGMLLEHVPRKIRIPGLVLTCLLIISCLFTPVLEIANFTELQYARFLSVVDQLDMQIYDWIRLHLPPDAIIQKGPRTDRINAPFSPIPTFAHRHTYVGDWMHGSIFLIPHKDYYNRVISINKIFLGSDAQKIHAVCIQNGIDYIYWGANEFDFFGYPTVIACSPKYFSVEYAIIFEDIQRFLFKVK